MRIAQRNTTRFNITVGDQVKEKKALSCGEVHAINEETGMITFKFGNSSLADWPTLIWSDLEKLLQGPDHQVRAIPVLETARQWSYACRQGSQQEANAIFMRYGPFVHAVGGIIWVGLSTTEGLEWVCLSLPEGLEPAQMIEGLSWDRLTSKPERQELGGAACQWRW